ncbi:MAG: T9SS type A sorting domain-containing protein, partial [Calditrichota bacterium]
HDILSLFFDDGGYTEVTRSYAWDGELERWNIVSDMNIDPSLPYNFAIHAVISPTPFEVTGDILSPSGPPSVLLLEPAYPNPFNAETRIHYQAPLGSPFSISLWDASGRQLRQLQQGSGGGVGFLDLRGEGLQSGYYFVHLETLNGSVNQRVAFIK